MPPKKETTVVATLHPKVKRRVTPANVLIEQDHDLWFVVWRKPRSRPRFLWSQLALYEAQRADQRGDAELAARLRGAATEAQCRNALNRSIERFSMVERLS
jgi:hypothetical protein